MKMSKKDIKVGGEIVSNDALTKNDMYGKISLNSCLSVGEQGTNGQRTYISKHAAISEIKLKYGDIVESVIFEEDIEYVSENISDKDYILNINNNTFVLYRYIGRDEQDNNTFEVYKIDEWDQEEKEKRESTAETISVTFEANSSSFSYGEVNYFDNENYYIIDSSPTPAEKKRLGIFDCSLNLKVSSETDSSVRALIRTVVKCPSCGYEDDRYDAQQVNQYDDSLGSLGGFYYGKSPSAGIKGIGYLPEPIYNLRCVNCGLLARIINIKSDQFRSVYSRINGGVWYYSVAPLLYTDASTFEYEQNGGWEWI